MKKIMVLGATGQIGTRVVDQLLKQGYIVYPASRSAAVKFEASNQLIPVALDVTQPLVDLTKLVKDVDAIIDTFGTGSNYLETELYGQIKVMEAAQANGIKRFIKLSGIGVEDIEGKIAQKYEALGYTDSIIAAHFADEWLETQSQLDWTVVRPVDFSDDEPTGQVKVAKLSETVFPNNIPMDDVASVLVDCLNVDETIKVSFAVSKGTDNIETALKSIK